jgi:predicted enzyme related to lactoylglutathione lyase
VNDAGDTYRPAGIGTIRCHVIDVGDFASGEAFWSEVTGLPVIGSGLYGRFSYLGQPKPWKHEIILQLMPEPKGPAPNRSHIDLDVSDVDAAIERIVAIGGSVKKPPSLYPRPGSMPGKVPVIDWAVMQDPFGNEFCLVSDLTRDEIKTVLAAAAAAGNDSTDEDWRRAAGRTAG